MAEFHLKKMHADSVAAALKKAEHYRLLNEPRQAESICRDILEVEPANRQATITLVLALTDQFASDTVRLTREAQQLLDGIKDEYDHAYYSGLVCERRATAHLESLSPGSSSRAYDWYTKAMAFYEQAEKRRQAGNDDPLLRWNACARIMMQNRLEPAHETVGELPLE